MKKLVSLLFVVLILVMCASPAFSAAETEPTYIYFIAPTEGAIAWKNYSTVFCHIWSKYGGDIYGWQEKNERCEQVDGYWRYDLSGIEFDPEGEYSLIFSNENGMQTYNLNVTSACLGDIAVCAGDTCVNPVDGEKTCAVARWTYNGDTVHPAIETDSSGQVLNVDEIDPADAVTVWGTDEGTAHELPEIAAAEEAEEDVLLIATASDEGAEDVKTIGADNADGINTNAATVWIIIVCVIVAGAIIAVTIVLAKKNKK